MIATVWDEHKDTVCVGISWELFTSRDHMLASYSYRYNLAEYSVVTSLYMT